MNYIIILAAVSLVVLYYIIAEAVCRLKERSFRRRLITGVLIAALIVSQTGIVNIFTETDAATAAAAEHEAEAGADAEETVEARSTEVRTVTAFAELREDIREQVVPVGTALEELVLPDTLEAVCVAEEADAEDDTDTSDSDVGGGTSDNEDDTEDETSNDGDDTEDETSNNGDDTEDETSSDGDNAEDETSNDDDVASDEEGETEDEAPESSGDDSEEETAETAVRTETGSFVMPEYRTEHVVEVKMLEDDSTEGEADAESEVINNEQPSEDSENDADSGVPDVSQDTIIIENIIWQSEPEYDCDTEGEYIFTAVLPEGYILTNGVNAPQITVTVSDIALLSGDIMPIAITFDGGSGSEDNPYLISSLDTFEKFRDDVNNGNTYEKKFIKLTKDINLGGSGNKWTCIGWWSNPFQGTFDGGGNTISGLYLNESSGNNERGLFGYVVSGTIKNLTVKGTVNSYTYNVGGIVGRIAGGNIENCYNEATVTGRANVGGIVGFAGCSSIKNCHNVGDITANALVAGIAGKSDKTGGDKAGSISGCSNTGTISATYAANENGADSQGAGGIVGEMFDNGVIQDCHNDGIVQGYGRVGGILGHNGDTSTGTITGCYNTGVVRGYHNGVSSSEGYEHGGIVGYACMVDIEQCYNIGIVSGAQRIGGIVGKIDTAGAKIVNSCNLGNITATEICGGIAGATYHAVSITYCYSSGTLSGSICGGIVGKDGDGTKLTLGYCYYLSGTASGECGYGAYTSSGEIKTMTQTELGSGEFALYLQGKLGGSLVWVQNLKNVYGDGKPTSKGPIPTGDPNLKVLTVTFMKKGTGTSYNTTHAKRYTNPGFGVTMPTDLKPSDSKKYTVVWWTSTNAPASGMQFTADSTVASDTTVYAYEQELYAGESSKITKTVTYGNGGTLTLSDSMQYATGTSASGTSSANKFTYTIKSGNDALKATINGDTLTIPKTAGAETYTLKITASEKSPQLTTYALGSYGTSDVTLTVEVIINKANSSVTTKPTVNSLTYTGSAQALVKAGSGSGGTMQYSTTSSSSGFSTTIPKGTDAGTYTVWYKVDGDANHNSTTPQSVTVTINQAPVGGTLSVDGTLKYGETLRGNMSGILPSGAKASDFTYTWKRDGDIISGADDSGYTLTKDDIGHTLTLTATAKTDGNYTGSVTSDTTETIGKADGPAVSGVSKTDETIKGKKDGTLTGLKTTMEYKLSTEENYTSVTTAGTVSGLAPGTYDVRVKETDTHNAGQDSAFTIGEGAGLTVIFDSNGGSSVSDITGISYDTTISAPTAPVRTGYDFDGWYKESGLTNKWDFASDKVTKNITLYAKWTVNGYAIIYKDEGDADFSGRFTGDYPTVHAYGTETVLVSPTKTGYSFKGWYDASDCTGDPVTSLAATGHTADITLYAKWVDDIAPEISLSYNYEPACFLGWLIGSESLALTVHVKEEGSGADVIDYTVTPENGTPGTKSARLAAAEETGIMTAAVNVDADFEGTIGITCTDKDDNTSEEVTVGEELVGKDDFRGIIIEDHAPQISIANGSQEISSSVYYAPEDLNLAVSIADAVNGSGSAVISGGIASVTYRIGSGNGKHVNEDFTSAIVTTCSFTIPASELDTGVNIVTVTAEDNAGNRAESDFTVRVKGPEKTPGAVLDEVHVTLTDLVPGAEYDITYTDADGEQHTDTVTADENGNLEIEDEWTGGNIGIVKKGNGTGTDDSEAQELEIPEREPGISEELTVTDESLKGAGDGKIGGLEPGEEYEVSTDGGETWEKRTANEGGELEPLAPGSYDVRRPAGDDTLPSKATHVDIKESDITQEETPEASVDKPNGRIKGLVPGAEYDITYTDKDGQTHTDTVTADENGNLEIEDDWTGGNIGIVKKGSGGDDIDSLPQELEMPEQESAPSDAKTSKKAGKDGQGGSIGGLTPGETYQISKDGGETWEDVTADEDGEIKPVEAGGYDIRKKAGDNTLPSKSVHVEVTKEKGGSSGGSGSGKGGSGSGGNDSGNSNGSQPSGSGNGETGTGTGTGTPGGTQPGAGDIAGTVGTGGTGSTGNTGNTGGTGNTGNASGTGGTGNTDKDKADRTAGGSGDGKESGSIGSPADGEPGSASSGSADAQTSDATGHIVQAELENGKIVISGSASGTDGTGSGAGEDSANGGTADSSSTGAAISTGTIGTAQGTTTILSVGEGAVIVTVVSDEYRCDAGVADTVAVANAVLTPEQKQHVNDGRKISVRVEVKDISGQVSQQDKDIIESGLADYKITDDIYGQEQGELTLGAYIDISMYIRVDDGDWDAVTHSDEPIEVVIGIPDELQSEGRAHYIARAHEGSFALLDDLDSEADIITIRTEKFSTYAIIFRQMLGTGADADASSGFPASLSWTAVVLWSLGILAMLGIAVFLIFRKRRKDGGAAA